MTFTFAGMNVLVTGGAGYVGSHAVKRLCEAGHHPVIYDSLLRGHRAVASILDVPAVYADIGHTERLVDALRANRIDCVMHFAALSEVGESVERPLEYFDSNVARVIDLLTAMKRTGVRRLVFSSTCAIYGTPARLPVTEDHPPSPGSPYAAAKLMSERIISDFAVSQTDFAYATLRYVNAAGASGDGSLGEAHDPETHLVPLLIRAATTATPITIHGVNLPTEDGTAIRDYVHVEDIADAHLRALEILEPSTRLSVNLGTGHGWSVLQMLAAVEQAAGARIQRLAGPPRMGDPAVVFASGSTAREVLGWRPKASSIERIVETALQWHRSHPRGYG